MLEKKIFTVNQINREIQKYLERNNQFSRIYIKGEISNFIAHPSGICYFSLKDKSSRIKALIYPSSVKNINFNIENGLEVIGFGSIGSFAGDGSLQFQVISLEIAGVGNLFWQFENLKNKLYLEGLFDNKKKLPKYPFKIGIISASKGAALQDILSTLKDRWPVAKVNIYPSQVQGRGAIASLIKSFKLASDGDNELLIVARGGGSYEDLIAFNDETLARTIALLKVPLVSGIGHEIDYTITDFVADLRAPTPTGAITLATPVLEEVKLKIDSYKRRLNKIALDYIQNYQGQVNHFKNHYLFNNYLNLLGNFQQRLDHYKNRLFMIIKEQISKSNHSLTRLKQRLDIIKNKPLELIDRVNKLKLQLDKYNHQHILAQGYAVVYNKDNQVISKINQLQIDQPIKIELKRGKITSIVKELEEK